MPFVQRVVKPTRLAQVAATTNLPTERFQCMPGKCKNNNCMNKIEKQGEENESVTTTGITSSDKVSAASNLYNDDVDGGSANDRLDKIQGTECNGDHTLERLHGIAHVKDEDTRIATIAIVHNNTNNNNTNNNNNNNNNNSSSQKIILSQTQTPKRQCNDFVNGHDVRDLRNIEEIENCSLNFNDNIITNNSTLTNGCSFTYGTDTEDALPPLSMPQTLSPLKKLKQHVEFLPPTSPIHVKGASSTPMTPIATTTTSTPSTSVSRQSQQQTHSTTIKTTTTTTSKSNVKLVTGYEFESISNITLSNALRQLASLVLLASDIFDDLHHELQTIGERTQVVHRKIISVEQRVTAYDPKLVTVPESDLLTFAQRKTHYVSEKAVKSELFSAETRPCSVRVLYEDAGRVSPPPVANHSHHVSASSSGGVSPRSATSDGIINGNADCCDFADTGVAMANAKTEELVCTPVFGKANRKMRTRIDAEIEIRLPAGLEDLRKWTSTEALGDVTVTPDCMAHVDTSISTSVIIGDNGILTPALSPSVLSADAVDALYSINSSNLNNHSQIPSDVNTDVPLNHRLPSPEEQCKIIALRYPAEIISVDTSGKRFQRMCMARKSTTGCFNNNATHGSTINSGNANDAGNSENATENNLNDDIQTVSRRSRSRKSRGKRRNTIAGIDQKEIQIAAAANGESTTNGENRNAQQSPNNEDQNATSVLRRNEEKTSSKKFGRSKSSDILKKESVALPYDKGKNTLTRLNSLKQWGRNRFKFMRNDYSAANTITLSPERCNGSGNNNDSLNNTFDQRVKQSLEQHLEITNNNSNVGGIEAQVGSPTTTNVEKNNLTDELDVHELMGPKSEGRFSHERKPSYSSSEKSVSVSSSGHLKGKLHLATCGNVKLRDTSSLNRQRRNGISVNGLGGKDEQPHSSSGNWSASSESGRASIGSEITIQPKSSASNTSLNCSSFHPGSGPPSSMMSRRRFLNTSASSSVTSEGTATPDLQVVGDGGYPCQLDDETSSAYSCDTEGYYTSFHMDSGLRTLKEEEPTLLTSQNAHSNSYSFGGQHNQTVLSAENEYELFGKGSTSTTTSSAGTVCTTLMANMSGEQSSMNSINIGPDVPERISSLGKLNRSRESTNSTSTSTLERSYSSSTMGSTLERTGTIKRNVNAGLLIVTSNVEINEQQLGEHAADTPESQEEEFEFEQCIQKRSAQPLPKSTTEMEVSESSDLEGVERIERIKQKTALNARRIPSMCIITPTTSDDDQEQDTDSKAENSYDPDRTLTPENSPTPSQRSLKTDTEETLGHMESTPIEKSLDKSSVEVSIGKDHNLNNSKRNSQYGLNNMLEKLKVVLPNIKRSPSKSSPVKTARNELVNDDALYDLAGEYVTIADVTNNNHARYKQLLPGSKSSGLGIYYSNDIVSRRKLLLSENSEYAEATLPTTQNTVNRSTEYVSLNELPTLRPNKKLQTKDSNVLNCAESLNTSEIAPVPMYAEISELNSSENSPLHTQKRVRLNAQGKVIYDSDSLKRRKGSHTTFAPGPFVKETESALPIPTVSATSTAQLRATSEVVSESATVKAIKNISTPAKLFLLNGGVAATRKIANVRPIISNTTLKRNHQQQSQQQQQQQEISNNKEMYSTAGKTMNPFNVTYQDKKNLLANQTNPFHQQPLPAPPPPPTQSIATVMMPSPSTKSTSSTGSSHSTNTSGSAGSSSNNNINNNNNEQQHPQKKDADYQHFYRAQEPGKTEQPPTSDAACVMHGMSFQRNSPVYWTLQNRRHNKAPPVQADCRDDLYATPIRRAERLARAGNTAATIGSPAVSSIKSKEISNGNSISPVTPRLRAGFHTSTPTRSNEPSPNRTNSGQFAEDSPERLNICADRIGQSKTSLLDFKKLLLAKSAKNSPVPRKVSAVELLKKNSLNQTSINGTGSTALLPISTANSTDNKIINSDNITANAEGPNSTLKLLDMSGSPKTFANRRMLRQGQFGSPSRNLAPKIKSNSPAINRQRTEIISTTIPEVNSEEDQSGQSASSSSDSSKLSSTETNSMGSVEHDAAEQTFDMKRNFFLQTEENNFMRGELKTAFGKSPVPKQKYVNSSRNANIINNNNNINNSNNNNNNSKNKSLPALETAL